MTGGQVAPTTPLAAKTKTSFYGNPEDPFDACELAKQPGQLMLPAGPQPILCLCPRPLPKPFLMRVLPLSKSLRSVPPRPDASCMGFQIQEPCSISLGKKPSPPRQHRVKVQKNSKGNTSSAPFFRIGKERSFQKDISKWLENRERTIRPLRRSKEDHGEYCY